MIDQIFLFQGLRTNTCVLPHGAEGGFEGEKRPRIVFCFDLRRAFYWQRVQPQEQERHNRRRSLRRGPRRKPFLGGSDPTLSGFSAAQRLRRRGSLPPKLSSRIPRSVAGRDVEEADRNSESQQSEENNIWP